MEEDVGAANLMQTEKEKEDKVNVNEMCQLKKKIQ